MKRRTFFESMAAGLAGLALWKWPEAKADLPFVGGSHPNTDRSLIHKLYFPNGWQNFTGSITIRGKNITEGNINTAVGYFIDGKGPEGKMPVREFINKYTIPMFIGEIVIYPGSRMGYNHCPSGMSSTFVNGDISKSAIVGS